MQDHKIDFVISWVDGKDQAWLQDKSKYDAASGSDDAKERYRDWENLKYWFRGVEKFAPWVAKIHFITWGHLPKWLDVNHPRLHIVRHEDYIPQEYLPTFNSHTIEWNMHRIEGLAEQHPPDAPSPAPKASAPWQGPCPSSRPYWPWQSAALKSQYRKKSVPS